MTDYISRADAIDAVCRTRCGDKAKGCPAHSCFVIEEFDALPSADATVGDYPNDLISRNALMEYCSNQKSKTIDNNDIARFPSADAVQGWRIGKPTEQGEYIVTLDSFGHKCIDLFYYGKPLMPNRKVRGKCWYRSDDEWGDVVYDDTDILAWQPLPKPYREDGEEE